MSTDVIKLSNEHHQNLACSTIKEPDQQTAENNAKIDKLMSHCVVCNEPFEEGDLLQAFLACPDDPKGSWTKLVTVDSEFQNRHAANKDKVKRKHGRCHVKEILAESNEGT